MTPTYPYFGIHTFAGAPRGTADTLADGIAVLGIPWDGGVGYRPGSRFGPQTIREVSARYPFHGGYYDLEQGTSILSTASMADLGDADVVVTDVERTFSAIEETITTVIRRGIRPLVLGGDHSVSLPVVRGLSDRPLGVLQFDAHLDYGDEFGGARYTSSTVMRRVRELSQVKSLIHAGIRGLRTLATTLSETQQDGNAVVSASRLSARPDALIEQLDGNLEWYVSVDLDVLDPSQAPGVSSPEPGGLAFSHLAAALATLRRRLRVVGCDVVELNPLVDPTGISALAAVYLALICASLLEW